MIFEYKVRPLMVREWYAESEPGIMDKYDVRYVEIFIIYNKQLMIHYFMPGENVGLFPS